MENKSGTPSAVSAYNVGGRPGVKVSAVGGAICWLNVGLSPAPHSECVTRALFTYSKPQTPFI